MRDVVALLVAAAVLLVLYLAAQFLFDDEFVGKGRDIAFYVCGVVAACVAAGVVFYGRGYRR